MKVENIKIVNFKAIENLEVNPQGKNVYVVGKNGAGKTSFIGGVFGILTGQDLPVEPLRQGEEKGEIEVDLGEIIVRATYTAENQKMNLQVSTPNGAKFSSPRKMLNEKLGVVDFNIAEFLALAPAKKSEQIQRICGLDFADVDSRYTAAFNERTYINRKVKELEAQSEGLDVADVKPVDTAAVHESLRVARVQNSAIEGVQTRIETRKNRRTSIDTEIEKLTKQIQVLKDEKRELDGMDKQAATFLKQNKVTDVQSLEKQLAEASEINVRVQTVEANKRKLAEFDSAKEEQGKLNASLADIANEKAAMIKAAKMPVEGMTFSESGSLLLNGLPFESAQINTASQIIAGLQICSALHKDVKIARFDGSLLDNDNLKVVEDWAEKAGVQLFIEIVSRDAQGLQVDISE